MENFEDLSSCSDLEEKYDFVGSLTKLNGDKTKTIFDISFTVPEDDFKKPDLEDYRNNLENEVRQWNSFLKSVHKELKSSNTKDLKTIDPSILSAEKRSYLNQAPDLQKFIKESTDFMQAANVFLNLDYEEFIETHDNLTAVCNYRLNLAKSVVLEKLSSVP